MIDRLLKTFSKWLHRQADLLANFEKMGPGIYVLRHDRVSDVPCCKCSLRATYIIDKKGYCPVHAPIDEDIYIPIGVDFDPESVN